jgi:hypothetical protein
MAGEPIDERRFTEEEVREILRRAVEDPPTRALVPREGTTLAELRSIGEEVGIDPSRIDQAARALTSSTVAPVGRVLGGPTVFRVERTVMGVPSREDAPSILAAIREATGLQGEMREIPGALEWSAEGDAGDRRITISSRGKETTIRATANLVKGATAIYLPVGLVASFVSLIGLLVFFNEGSESALALLLILPILYPILRTIWSRISDAESAKLHRAVDDVAGLVGEIASPPE